MYRMYVIKINILDRLPLCLSVSLFIFLSPSLSVFPCPRSRDLFSLSLDRDLFLLFSIFSPFPFFNINFEAQFYVLRKKNVPVNIIRRISRA